MGNLTRNLASKILPALAKMGVFASNSLKNGAVNGPKRLKIDQKGLQIVLMNQSIPFLGPK